MLTPQEVSERAFQKASFGGYNMGQVDEFLDVLTGDYSALYSENAVLKSKMKVLVDKVEEYRSTEEAMRKALMTAQRMADTMVKEAEQKKAEMLQQAEGEARQRKQALEQELQAEEYRLAQAKEHTAQFVAQVKALQAAQAQYLDQLSQLSPAAPVHSQEDRVDEAAEEIDDNVQRLLAQAMQEATAANQAQQAQETEQDQSQPEADLSDTAEFSPVSAQPQPEEQAQEEDVPPARRDGRIDFGSLQFGRDYEIK